MPEDPKGFVDKAAAGDAFAGVDREALEALIEERFSSRSKSENALDDFIKQCQELRREQLEKFKKGVLNEGPGQAAFGFQSLLERRFTS